MLRRGEAGGTEEIARSALTLFCRRDFCRGRPARSGGCVTPRVSPSLAPSPLAPIIAATARPARAAPPLRPQLPSGPGSGSRPRVLPGRSPGPAGGGLCSPPRRASPGANRSGVPRPSSGSGPAQPRSGAVGAPGGPAGFG